TAPAVSRGGGNGSADDPVVNGGSVRILTTDGCAGPCDDTYPLPSGGWSYVGAMGDNKGYKFLDPAGPLKLVLIRAGPHHVVPHPRGAPHKDRRPGEVRPAWPRAGRRPAAGRRRALDGYGAP